MVILILISVHLYIRISIKMGAACTTLDVSPEATRIINNQAHSISLPNANYETIWACIAPYIKIAVDRYKIRGLLQRYLTNVPCRDRFLVVKINDRQWMFEIMGNNPSSELTEIVLSHRPAEGVGRKAKN